MKKFVILIVFGFTCFTFAILAGCAHISGESAEFIAPTFPEKTHLYLIQTFKNNLETGEYLTDFYSRSAESVEFYPINNPKILKIYGNRKEIKITKIK